MTIDFSGMREDISALIDAWGTTCTIKRFSGALNDMRVMSGSESSVADEVFWIQPVNNFLRARDMPGIIDGTTDIAYQYHGGTDLEKDDTILKNGDVYSYDVTGTHVYHSHKVVYLKRVKKD